MLPVLDIAPSMIAKAGQYNRFGARCDYIVNDHPDLNIFNDGNFSFIITLIVLQHMEPRYSKAYIREFLRVLKPGGLCIFQIPSEEIKADNHAYALPDRAFKAAIRMDKLIASAPINSPIDLMLHIKNVSDFTWPGASVNVGNHWYSTGDMPDWGRKYLWDDERKPVMKELKP
jgi:ubiquinone/menaquinone biosynthesis C-methylase UbiE